MSLRESGLINATLGSKTLAQGLAVRPIGIGSVTLTPTSVAGGNPVTGKVTLECKAAPTQIDVKLESTNPAIATPSAGFVTVPYASLAATFNVWTTAVTAKKTATMSATANTITKSKVLTLTPAAVVAPTGLKFGSLPVGQTSASQNATLTNKGTAPFFLNAINLTGTYANWFVYSHNCPASLSAGASCVVTVAFKPQSAASKSARLSIATSATSTPLSVSLSGTGF